MRILIILAMAVSVAGFSCSSDEETVGKEIADDYNEAMDKAREVEDQLMEHKGEIDEALKDAMDEVDEALEEAEEAIEDATN